MWIAEFSIVLFVVDFHVIHYNQYVFVITRQSRYKKANDDIEIHGDGAREESETVWRSPWTYQQCGIEKTPG